MPTAYLPEQINDHSVPCRADSNRLLLPQHRGEPSGIFKESVKVLIPCKGVLVEEAEVPDSGSLGQFHSHDIAGVPPVLPDRGSFRQGVLGVKDQKVRILKKINEAGEVFIVPVLVLVINCPV